MQTKCTREVVTPDNSGLEFQRELRTAMERRPWFCNRLTRQRCYNHRKSGANTYTFNLRDNEMARMAGLEPATAALTVRCSTIELHPNWWRESDSNRRSSGYEPAAGTTPVNPALSHETIVKPCQVLQLPRKSRHQHKRIPRKSVTPFSRLFSPWPVPDDGRSARSRTRRQTPAQLPPRCALRPYRPRRSPACGRNNASRTPPAPVS